MSRAKFFEENPQASAWAALDEATNAQMDITPGPIQLKKGSFKGKRAIIIGAGVSGLTTAYELLAQESGMEVTIFEAHNRTGGRCLSLRTGDTLTEDDNSSLCDSEPGDTQVVRFKRPLGDNEPYLNAGPGRIPSAHKRLLHYLKEFGVDLEVYVMNSESNLVQMKGGPGYKPDAPLTYRRLDHNTRGWLAQMVFENADELVKSSDLAIPKKEQRTLAKNLKSLMVTFGELGTRGDGEEPLPDYGKYRPTPGQDGFENGRARAGYTQLPGVDAGITAKPIEFKRLLESKFWEKTRFYQPVDFLWQPTLFQPVGGMDRVQHAFAQQVAALGGEIHLNSPVESIDWDGRKKEFVVGVSQIGTDKCIKHRADYVFCNMAIPFLRDILSNKLQNSKRGKSGLASDFKKSLHAVYESQFEPKEKPKKSGYVPRFLACTTKVGWQADRSLWQGSSFKPMGAKHVDATTLNIPKSEFGVVPIYGGISWTDDEITQIWYPSNDYHDEKGILTGTYNFGEVAYKWGKTPIKKRLKKAQKGAAKFGAKFANGLDDGVAIAWQNMPYIKGGWAQWHVVDDAVKHFNILDQGSGIYDSKGKLSDPVFFIIGDQLSSLPGWQEGAIAAALNALSRMARPDLYIPHLSALPDTRLIVEGI
ncbi:MAG: FAD-dependent oxidoreductase [Pseudomonadota bacterium]